MCSQEKVLNVLVLPDKFKGTLTAWEVGEAVAAGWRASRPQDRMELQPISDGGEGFGEVLARPFRAQRCSVQTVNAAHQAQIAPWWWEPVSRTAVIESAAVIGLALLPPGQYHPFELDSRGLAAPLREAIRQGARRCLLGLGGSATNDGGFGVARALGWQFLDHQGRALQQWSELTTLARVCPLRAPLDLPELVVAADVQNPLLGPNGATRVYGPQKGLVDNKDLVWAERCLARLAEVVDQEKATWPGSGAAGGLGFGLACFLGGRLESGFALLCQRARLCERIRAADLVITGEGSLDRSSLMGKGVGEIAKLCQQDGIPCLGLAGRIEDPVYLERWFDGLYSLVPDVASRTQAHEESRLAVEQLAARIACEWPEGTE